ncbi:MAG TPA: bifunctional transaldolase/phosoglucose isomerase [Caulobacteraceae bacterium]|nr:bifunctional transaldolase/phosoglucose isomerase [Caulobacteraceae bacterium]
MNVTLRALAAERQSVWLDYLHRDILQNGELKRMIEEDGLSGLTSNPSIFEKAIAESDTYDTQLADLIERRDAEAVRLFEALAVEDIRAAADLFRPVWEQRGGGDGFVSLEVSPYLARDTEGTIAEARRLWAAVDRPNLMIKVPGVPEGVDAIRTLIGEGINVNVTLLFSIDAYLAVAEAHIAGLEAWRARGGDVAKVHGVASFFVSRIDTIIDKRIDDKLKSGAGDRADALKALRGKIAIANAKIAYQRYLEIIATPRWRALAEAGAQTQRLLWASTGTKDPTYSDVLYVDTLIGADTINTMPPKTLAAFADHGEVRPTLTEDVEGAREILARAEALGLDLAGATKILEDEGVDKFSEAFDGLLGAVEGKRARLLGAKLDRWGLSLPADLRPAYDEAMARAAGEGWSRRLWAKDRSLWTNADEDHWLGWLAAAQGEAVNLEALEALSGEARRYSHALLMGMGGSSLGPEVLAQSLGARQGHPQLLALDTTDPDQIGRVGAGIDPADTLFIVSSKSGSTLEPNILCARFYAEAERALGQGKAGERFVAVTDPGSDLERSAREDGFGHTFYGDPEIGGRYSVLSNFGMVPAAVLGLDVRAAFDAAGRMVRSCAASVPPKANPGVALGTALGVAAKAGRDKVTFLVSPPIAPLGAWLEQLLAESTGKRGKGLIPVAGEPVGKVGAYRPDRFFVWIRLEGEDDPDIDEAARALEEAGHPVARIVLADKQGLFQEFFRWEVAVAIAGAVIGINPFDQPDVEAAKVKARELADAYERDGALPNGHAALAEDGLAVYADPANAKALEAAARGGSVDAWLRAHFDRIGDGDYVALLPYLDRNEPHEALFRRLQGRIRDRRHAATALGFGPSFQHSTGQAYKGGPNTGVFLQITAEPAHDLPIPGRRASFGVIEAAQARGDLEVLAERGRRALRVHLGDDIEGGLERLEQAVDRALS